MQPDDSLTKLKPQIMILDNETYAWLINWFDELDDNEYPKLRALFATPRVFTRDCE
jgi:hypothetical protein